MAVHIDLLSFRILLLVSGVTSIFIACSERRDGAMTITTNLLSVPAERNAATQFLRTTSSWCLMTDLSALRIVNCEAS